MDSEAASKGALEAFLEASGGAYGLGLGPGGVERMRDEEFSRLRGAAVYLDYAGAALHSSRQTAAARAEVLDGPPMANPHSGAGPMAERADDAVEAARDRVLRHFNVSRATHGVVFVASATAAAAAVARCFPWARGSRFAHSVDNHTSVLGVREEAAAAGAAVRPLRDPADALSLSPPDAWSLLAYPGESNFDGRRHDLGLARRLREACAAAGRPRRWCVLLDAAKLAASAPLDLAACDADFVCVSFYKMFGYPSGVGALLVRNDSEALLRPRYFGGGTVAAVAADSPFVRRRAGLAERLEHGSLPFLAVAQLVHGFDQLDRFGMARIDAHASSLARHARRRLAALRHASGTPVCVLYGSGGGDDDDDDDGGDEYGPVVAFNVLDDEGRHVGHASVGRAAAAAGFQVRVGCFCNAGACQTHLGLSGDDVRRHHEEDGRVCGDEKDLLDGGQPTGAVRVSFGYSSVWADADAWVRFVERQFARPPPTPAAVTAETEGSEAELSGIFVYPIKSCAPVSAREWPLGRGGLALDREFSVVTPGGVALSQKRVPAMALVRPVLDAARRTMTVHAPPGGPAEPLVVRLDDGAAAAEGEAALRVCGSARRGELYGGEVAAWFARALGRPCTLARRPAGSARTFSNEAQLLLVSESSAAAAGADASRFRGNLVVRGAPAWAEDSWRGDVRVGGARLRATGPCKRCAMVNIDQRSSAVEKGPDALYSSLARERRAVFGVLLERARDDDRAVTLRVGDAVAASETATLA